MKKLLSITICSLFLIMGLQAQESAYFEKKNALKISPVAFKNAEFQISYEHYFGDRSSSFTFSPSVILKENSNESESGYQIEGQYRFFLSHLKDGENGLLGLHNVGFYAGIYTSYMDYNKDYLQFVWDQMTQTETRYDLTKEVKSVEGGALVGMQVDITKRILIDFYVGGGIRKSDIVDSIDTIDFPDEYNYGNYYGVFDREYTGVKPEIGFQLGITF